MSHFNNGMVSHVGRYENKCKHLCCNYVLRVVKIKTNNMVYVILVLLHIVTRGSEIAVGKKSSSKTKTVHEPHIEYSCLQQQVDRLKTDHENSQHMYCHKNSMFQDFYFTYLYLLVLDENSDSNYIFPTFADKVLVKNQNGKTVVDSRVSEVFSSIFNTMSKAVDDYKQGKYKS